jgi:predicted nucleotidyltransferase
VKQLSTEQRELVLRLAGRLGVLRGIEAVVLGGSHARGQAQPSSDVDLGILYTEANPFSIQSIRELADEINDTLDQW